MRLGQKDKRERSRDSGASAVEYGGVLLLVAAIVAALVTIGVPGRVSANVDQAICRIFGGECQAQGPPGPTTIPSVPPTPGQQNAPPTPAPSPGPVVPQPLPPPEQTETESVLNETQLGRDALAWAKQYGVAIIYRRGGGSYYSDDDNVVYIDTDQSPEERAVTFVHEINHAKNRDQPDPKKMGRDEYVDKSIDEETNGTVLEIQANQQLQDKRGPGKVPNTLLQTEYQDAYHQAIADENKARAQNNRPPLTPEQARQVGADAGRGRVKQAFEKGEVQTSNTGDGYRDYYGKSWDDAHDCFLWIFC
jgi:Flp pilus assembly pilin Flp